jgi:hypothetical protein
MRINSQDSNIGYFKKHFVCADFIGGFSMTNFLDCGGHAGLSVGYLYLLNDYVGLGAGINGLFTIMAVKYYDNDLNLTTKADFTFSGGLLLFKMIIGDFKKSFVAFLLDIGIGWLAGIYIGVLIKSFTIKLGYTATYLGVAHNISLSCGFMINLGKN